MHTLKKRFYSFLWRQGGLVGVAMFSFLLEPSNLTALKESGIVLPAVVIAVLGGVVGELTKYLNKKKK